MAKKDWRNLKENGSPDFYACVDGPIEIDEDTVVIYSKNEPGRIGDYYRSGNSRKIIKAEWRQSKTYGKFLYILHEDKSSEYWTNGSRGLVAEGYSGIVTDDFAQPEDYQNFPQNKSKEGQTEEKKSKKGKQLGFFGRVKRIIKIIIGIFIAILIIYSIMTAL